MTHTGVKEASERAIIHLRSLQTQYVAAVRRAGASTPTNTSSSSKNNKQHQRQQPPSSGSSLPPQHPTTALFQSQDVLRPFLLAANYPDASYDLLVIALESMQHLLQGDAICPEDGMQISRVLAIQSWGCAMTLGLGVSSSNSGENGPNSGGGGGGMAAGMMHAASGALGGITGMVLGGGGGHSHTDLTEGSKSHHQHYQNSRSVKEDESIALKVLQTITSLADSRSVKLTEEVLGACLSVCLILGAGQTYNEHSIGMGATIRERLTQQNAVNVKDASGGSTGGSAGNVKRAAFATMSQVISILFDKAKETMVAIDDEAWLLSVAKKTFTDLCTIAKKSSSTSISQSKLKMNFVGPLAVAAKEGLSPSPTTSLALLDMLLKQFCGDLFAACFHRYESDMDKSQLLEDVDATQPGLKFATEIINQAFQLGQSLLGSQYCYHVTKITLEFSLKEVSKDTQSSPASDLLDFCSYYYTTSLASTMLTCYLSSTSSAFYGNFVSNNGSNRRTDSGSGNSCTAMRKMALDMINQLVSFVSEATEAYHKSDDFEDGYIFTQSERESFDIGKKGPSNNRARTHSQGSTPEQALSGSAISNDKLWRAFLAMDVLSQLVVSSHVEQLSWLDTASGGSNNNNEGSQSTVGIIAKSVSDFATISTSNRERILLFLLAADGVEQTILEADTKDKSTSALGDAHASGTENSTAAATVAAKVTDALVIDTIEIPLCDAGATTLLAFKSILLLVKSLKELAITSETIGNIESQKSISEMINGSFASSVSMLQHFVKRMLGSPSIVTQTLLSYDELACASMAADSQSKNVRRQAILTSLCKLCLPSWGKRRPHR